jgi:uncharacterized protein (TIGR03435 family)
MESNPQMLRGNGVDMKTVADALSGILLRPVMDETRLAGAFDLEMQFSAAEAQATDAVAAPTIFTAISEQLGLRLEAARAPAPVFVVEQIHRPSEN